MEWLRGRLLLRFWLSLCPRRSQWLKARSGMLVEFALLDENDTLLERSSVRVSAEAQCSHLNKFHIAYQLIDGAAKLALSDFSPELGLRTVNLDMPLHQSSDWESIAIARYTFAFRCSLDSAIPSKD
jgi:hypothetical protein